MSKFDVTVPKKAVKTTNHVGAVAYEKSANFELISTLLTSFVEDNYYKGKTSTLSGLAPMLAKVNPLFAAKAAVYARTKFGMRSISHAVASELAKHVSGQPWAKDFYNAIIHRPDDILEILSYHFGNKQKLSKAMQKGLASAFAKFDAYQLAKYKGEGKAIKLVDAVNILHPISSPHNGTVEIEKDVYWNALSDKMKKTKNVKLRSLKSVVNVPALDALMMGLLKSEGTWEAELSAAGQKASNDEEKAEFKKDVWISLIRDKKLGYFALLRNLRNIITQAPEIVDEAVLMLTNEKLIKKSLVLPFRFLSAYEEISAMRGSTPKKSSMFEKDNGNYDHNTIEKVIKGIDDAAKLSVANIPLFLGKTLILSDNSGSMTGDKGGSSRLSKMTERKTSDVANLFAVLCWLRSENTAIGLFGDRLIEPKLDRSKGVFDNFNLIDAEKNKCGASTEAGIFEMMKKLINEKIMVNRIVIFSDCQIGKGCGWYGAGYRGHNDFDRLFQEYRKINPDFMCYSIDLKNYATTVFDKGVVKLAGMSEKIFEIMSKIETDKHSLIKEIEEISFTNQN